MYDHCHLHKRTEYQSSHKFIISMYRKRGHRSNQSKVDIIYQISDLSNNISGTN